MAKLILSMDGLVLKEYSLTKERTTLGRKAHNDIVIDNLAVSGEHLVIVTILNDSFLEDLGSTNGTMVNGNAVKKHFLQNNDVVEIGKYKLKYVNEAQPAQGAPADFEKTMVLRAPPKHAEKPAEKPAEAQAAKSFADTHANLPPMATAAAPQPAAPKPAAPPPPPAAVPPPPPAAAQPAAAPKPAPAPQPPAPAPAAAKAQAGGAIVGAIQILTGPSMGKEMELTKTLTTLGKPGLQVAVITKRPQGYFITHVEGASFPVVNGKALDAQAHLLGDHDVIELAGVKMEFFIKT